MKRRDLNYIIFAGIGSFVASAACLTLVIITANRTLAMADYPSYSYASYIDCTTSKTYSASAGGQLFEAESMDLAGAAKVQENIHASNQEVVSSLSTGSTLSFHFESENSGNAKLVFATSYISQTNRTIRSENLFRINVNNFDVTLSSFIVPSYNEYDFIENDVALIHVNAGSNTITLTSFDDSYTLDYLVLVSPSEKTDTSSVINYHQEEFLSKGKRQDYQAEIQNDISGAVILPDEDLLSEYAVYFTNSGDSLTYYINSDEETTTHLTLVSRKENKSKASPSIYVFVNEEELVNHSMSKITSEYTDIDYGEISLNKGLNTITIQNRGGSFYLDAISLNSNINYSNSDQMVTYEAEEGRLEGCAIATSSTASSKKVVGYNFVGSYVEYSFTSLEPVTNHLALRLSYTGSAQPLNKVISISVNGYEISSMNKDTLENTGRYDNYIDVYGGQFTLPQGNNILRIVSVSGSYDLDYITLFKSEVSVSQTSDILESEHAVLDSQKIHFNAKASNNLLTKHSTKGATSKYYIYSDADRNVNLRNVLSYVSYESVVAEELFSLKLNEASLDLSKILIPISASVSQTQNVNFGTLAFQKGLNIFEFTDNGIMYYFDYSLVTI